MQLYHYTSAAGVDGILESGFIQSSGDVGDAHFGEGVYLTKKAPGHYTKTQIARNNWDDGYRQARTLIKWGRVDYAIRINIPGNAVEKAPSKRDIYIYPGDLSLDDYDWEVVEV